LSIQKRKKKGCKLVRKYKQLGNETNGLRTGQKKKKKQKQKQRAPTAAGSAGPASGGDKTRIRVFTSAEVRNSEQFFAVRRTLQRRVALRHAIDL
jgi:50S ribosomal subunit-associated GTPase HflX